MIAAVEQCLYERLSAASGLNGGVYAGLAPEGQVRPYTLFTQASTDTYRCGDTVIGNIYQYAVEHYQDGESFPHDQAAIIESSLAGWDGLVGDIRISIVKLRDLSFTDSFNGREIRRSGGMYRVIAR